LELIAPSSILNVVPMVVLVQMNTDPEIDLLVSKEEVDAD
jgi:hypothetical protein